MRKIKLYSLMCLASLLILSCKKDDEKVTPIEQEPTQFSELTVSQNKAKLESNGIDLIKNLEDLKNSSSIDAVGNLLELINSEGTSEMERSSSISLLKTLNKIRLGKGSASDVFSAMRLKGTKEEFESIQQFFDENAGTYTWNKANDDWDYLEGGSSIIFKFPSTENGASNNAVLTIGEYQGKVSTNPFDGYEGDLPTNLKMDLKINNTKVMGFDFKAGYNANGEPTSTDISLSLDAYTFTTKMVNNTQNVGLEHSLKKGNVVLIAMGVDTKGNFSGNNIENSEEIDEVVHEATAYLQLMNIKIAGSVDAKNLYKELNEEENYDAEKEVALYNKYSKLYVYYVDSNKKIADTEFYSHNVTETYEYDNNGDGIPDGTVVNEYLAIDIRLLFADGSKSDLETYTNTGFSDFKTELENFLEDIN